MRFLFGAVQPSRARLQFYALLVLLTWTCQGRTEVPADGPLPEQRAGSIGNEANAAMAYLTTALLPDELLEAMSREVRKSPDAIRWSGHSGKRLFAVVVRQLPLGPDRDRLVPGILQLAQVLAIGELLLSKAVTDRFVPLGLTDVTALREALQRTSDPIRLIGSVRELEHRAGVHDAYCVAYVVGDESMITARMLRRESISAVRKSYRDAMYARMQVRMQNAAWTDAIAVWDHVHSLGIEAPEMCLDAARCYRAIEKSDDALRILEGAVGRFGIAATAEFFEQAGDIALGLPGDSGSRFAVAAYVMASRRLSYQVIKDPAESCQLENPPPVRIGVRIP